MTYAGNHGLEILHPDGSRFVHPMPKEYEDKVSVLLKVLQEQVNNKYIGIDLLETWTNLSFLGLQRWCLG